MILISAKLICYGSLYVAVAATAASQSQTSSANAPDMLQQLVTAIGAQQAQAVADGVPDMEAALRQLVTAMPTNEHGRLG
eukprot:CAMPEP_0168503242 /NCGR_PEP_ID=MMETSP0228-20121227/75758_1 /TAXON_ID=133427 /ORGANISM="Protoceratium reticulatum, Strain CCCM 535 (=CCMP 1889)" /LENGTH=79 /DNA_ID=CAMNT_0008520299 /DNA_START=60 /DNA_END=295 /DNA_ORIENTATION=-